MASKDMNSLKQNICGKDKEMGQLTHLLEAKEVEEERRRSGHEKELDDELRGEISDLKAQLTEEEDRKMEAEEELKNLQSRVTEMAYKEMVYCMASNISREFNLAILWIKGLSAKSCQRGFHRPLYTVYVAVAVPDPAHVEIATSQFTKLKSANL